MIFYVDCRESLFTQELDAFERVRAIFFCDGVILLDDRTSKYAWGAD